MKSVLLLGSTGSIGTQTIDLVRADRAGLRLAGLAAGSSWELLLAQAREFDVSLVALSDEGAAAALHEAAPELTVFAGSHALRELVAAAEFDVCVHGVVGGRGLVVSQAVLERGKVLALANKESLVIAGRILMELAEERGGVIVPVDSEHSAIFQCMRGEDVGRVRRMILTASGGPFRTLSAAELSRVTPQQALRHPNWDMGPRITVGSATLMNKALEVIEVHHLFGLERERIEVAVHPQSIVHSMVEFVDGSVIAQMGPPDMRGPIHYALHHPDRAPNTDLAGFDFDSFSKLEFEAPDLERFPALALGFRCVEEGSDAGCVLNASDEVAVEAFLGSQIAFQDIPRINQAVLDQRPGSDSDVDALLASDAAARALARDQIEAGAAG